MECNGFPPRWKSWQGMKRMMAMAKAATLTALALVAAAFAQAFTPPETVRGSEWAASNLVVADGPRAGQKWSSDLTPQLVDILDCLTSDAGHTQVVFRKSAQVGSTGIGIAWLGVIVDKTPAKAMVIFPTLNAVQDFNREKLTPTIEATDVLARKIRMQTSRSARGSTAMSKAFAGGSITLTGANSTVDLRSKTVRYQFRDEIDDWPFDLDGQGDPAAMADARLMAFHATGDFMVFKTSTPTIKGRSRIDEAFEAGDQRFWMVSCPHCGHEQRLVFGGKNVKHGLKFNQVAPFNAHYVCAGSGCIIEHHEKPDMIRSGQWKAHNSDGAYPSFHLDALSSLLTTWDLAAAAFVAAKEDPLKLKAFVNLWLGESWEERGDAPEWQRLMERREDYKRATIPAGGLLHTLAMDVQKDGIFFERLAWGRDGQSWPVDIGFLEGATDDISNPVWGSAAEVIARRCPDQLGNDWPLDLAGVDAGYNSKVVYEFCRGRPNVMALKGQPGWYHPAVGTPTKVAVTSGGKRSRKLLLWPIGTWPLKSLFYAYLRKAGVHSGEVDNPPGYCHFARWLDEPYFRQLVSEYIHEKTERGVPVRQWRARGDNHFHDCRIYNLALFDRLGGFKLSVGEWDEIEKQRAVLSDAGQPELFAPGPSVSDPAPQPRRRAKFRKI
jgi:phage terminase large subunit GpA-like protein